MKFLGAVIAVFGALVISGASIREVNVASARKTQHAMGAMKDRTLTTVVKKLQQMLEESKKEADAEHEAFAKYQCYCDTTLAEKANKLDKAKDSVDKQESEIQKLQGENGELSSQCAALEADVADNEKRRAEADAARGKANTAFSATEKDLTTALSMMRDAIDTLSSIGADQTLEDAANDDAALADHDQYMSKVKQSDVEKSLVFAQTDKQIRTASKLAAMERALVNAAAYLRPEKQKTISAFLEQRLWRHGQPAFTGTYSAQSGEIVGILKNMKDTFSADLEEARDTEATEVKAHTEWTADMEAAHDDMHELLSKKQSALGNNDQGLAEARKILTDAVEHRDSSIEFSGTLTPICARKAKEYEERKMLHGDEQAALAEAISILDSDETFATYGKLKKIYKVTEVDATPLTFIQLAGARGGTEASLRRKIGRLLAFSPRFRKITVLLRADNPFKEVLAEIRKMIQVIAKEAIDDVQKKSFCVDEIDRLNTDIKARSDEIDALEARKKLVEAEIAQLVAEIATLAASIADAENQIAQAKDKFKKDTETYEDETATESSMMDVLGQAIEALEAYYGDQGKIHKGDAVKLDPVDESLRVPAKELQADATAKTWSAEADFAAQAAAAGDRKTGVIGILQKIADEMEAAQIEEHLALVQSQMDFEQFLEQQTTFISTSQEEKDSKETLLAEAHNKEGTVEELGLIPVNRDLEETQRQKASLEGDKSQITPGCDFILQNIMKREAMRTSEKSELNKAIELLEGSDIFKRFLKEQESQDLGKCSEKCVGKFSDSSAACKACLAGVTVDGYCAGHPGSPGC